MKKDGIAYLCWLAGLVGLCGIHRFYLGQPVIGVLYLFTLGFFGIGQLVDLFQMPTLVIAANQRLGLNPPAPQVVIQVMDGNQVVVQGAAAVAARPAETRKKSKEEQEDDLMQALLHAAHERGGRLSVTEGVLATGKGFKDVEGALSRMLQSGYVDVDNDPQSGVVVYRFRELLKD
jgi:TM2 domain-containing membrane protein YozV